MFLPLGIIDPTLLGELRSFLFPAGAAVGLEAEGLGAAGFAAEGLDPRG